MYDDINTDAASFIGLGLEHAHVHFLASTVNGDAILPLNGRLPVEQGELPLHVDAGPGLGV